MTNTAAAHIPVSREEVDTVARRLAAARREYQVARAAARVAAQRMTEQGLSEVEIARQLGVDRMTVRSWFGKR